MSILRPASSTLFPYTTLFRSRLRARSSKRSFYAPIHTESFERLARGSGRNDHSQLVWALLFLEAWRSEEHTSDLQSPCNIVCRLLLEKNIVDLMLSVM